MIKMFAAALAVGLFAPVLVNAEMTFFTVLNAHYGVTDINGVDSYQLNDRGTRFGFKGAEYLEDDLEASYFVEVESDIAGNDDVIGEVRQAWLGLRGSFGEIRAGRHLSPGRVSIDPVDRFDDQSADQTAILESDVLHDKSIAYINSFNNIGYAIAFSSNDENNRISTDVLANYNFDRLYLSAAYLKGGDHLNTLRLGASYRFPAGHRLGAAFENLDDTQANRGHNAYLMSGGYQLGKAFFKAQLGRNNPDAGGEAETLAGFGVDYELSESAELQFQYSINKHRDHTAGDSERALTLGLEYQF